MINEECVASVMRD